MAAANGIIKHYDQSLLKDHGGLLNISKSWAASLISRMHKVKRKGTRAARKVPTDFEDVKSAFLTRVKNTIEEAGNPPPQLIMNFDQTGCKFVPCSEWTLAVQGSKQVEIKGLDDKREMTVLLSITMSGKLLPPQLIYAGKTHRCHPNGVQFPSEWNIMNTVNHWSNEATMLEYADQVLIPYVEETKAALLLPQEMCAVAFFDVFAAHRCASFCLS